MRLLAAVPATVTASALLLGAQATPVHAVSTGNVVHLATAGQEAFAPATVTVARGTDLLIANLNNASYTYIVSDGASSWSTGAVGPRATGAVTLPNTGTFTLSRVGGMATGTVVVL